MAIKDKTSDKIVKLEKIIDEKNAEIERLRNMLIQTQISQFDGECFTELDSDTEIDVDEYSKDDSSSSCEKPFLYDFCDF